MINPNVNAYLATGLIKKKIFAIPATHYTLDACSAFQNTITSLTAINANRGTTGANLPAPPVNMPILIA